MAFCELLPRGLTVLLKLLEGLVVWQPAAGKPEIGQGVFVGTVNSCLIGQSAQRLQGLSHLLGFALEQPPAAANEQRVAAEQHRAIINLSFRVVGNMVESVARYRHDVEGQALPDHFVTGMDRVGGALEGGILRARYAYIRKGLCQAGDAARVVGVVVGDQYGIQNQLLTFQVVFHRLGLPGVYHQRFAG